MIKEFDTVTIKATGEKGNVIEIDDNGGKNVPIYLVELRDKPADALVSDVIKWFEYSEITVE